MYYAETFSLSGRWISCVFTQRPDVKNGSIRTTGVRIRSLSKISDNHCSLDLGIFKAIYGKGE